MAPYPRRRPIAGAPGLRLSWLAFPGLLFLGLMYPLNLYAQDDAASGSIEISALAPEKGLAPQAGRTRLNAEEIASSGAASLEELIGRLSGLEEATAGGRGAQSSPSIRGSTGNSVLVVVDGIPVNDIASGLCDLGRLGLSLSDIESVELVKGGLGSAFGPDASAGAILISTKDCQGKKGMELEMANRARLPFSYYLGSGFQARYYQPSALSLIDGQSLGLRAWLPSGLYLSASGQREENAYAYRDSGGIVRQRQDADYLGAETSLGWAGLGLGGQLRARFNLQARDIGLPGSQSALTPEDAQRDARAQLSLSYYRDSFFSEAVAFSLTAFGLGYATEYIPADDEESRHLATRYGINAAWSALCGTALELGAGISARYDRLDSSSVQVSSGQGEADGEGSAPQRILLGAYAEPRLRLGGFSLSPAARIDYTPEFGPRCSLSLGMAWAQSKALLASLIASSAYRLPSFDDLYWPSDSFSAGNSELVPERSLGLETRLDYTAKEYAYSVSLFARYVEDVILWQAGDDGIWRPSNWGEALYPGAELSGHINAGGYTMGASWTILRTYALSGGLELSDDVRLPMVAEHSLKAHVGRGDEGQGWVINLSYLGPRYLKLANTDYLESRFLLGGELRARLSRSLVAYLRGENILNEAYQEVAGYPMPGFSLSLGLRHILGDGKKK